MKKFMLFILVILSVFSLSVIGVNAEDKAETPKCKLCGADEHDVSELDGVWISSDLAHIAYDIALTGTDDFFGETSEKSSSVKALLVFDIDKNSNLKSITDMALEIYGSVSILGGIIIFIYFLIDLAEITTEGKMTPDTFAHLIFRTFLAFFIIRNGGEFLVGGIKLASQLFNSFSFGIANVHSYPYTPKTCPFYELTNAGIKLPITAIGIILENAIPFAVVVICKIILNVILWGRVLDIAVRIMFAPIGMADTMHGGLQSHGVIYFKKFMSVCLQGVVILGVLFCYNLIASTIRTSIAGWVGTAVLGFTVIGMIKQTSNIAEELLGIR